MRAEIEDFADALRERSASPHTVASYTRDLRLLASWLEAQGRPITTSRRVSYLVLRRYLNFLARQGLESGTIRRKLTSFRAFWKWLQLSGRAQTDPTAAIALPRLEARAPTILPLETIEAMLEVPPQTPFGQRDRALLEFLYGSGARLSEAAQLNLEDVLWRSSEVRLQGAAARIVPLGRPALAALKEYLETARGGLLRRHKLGDKIEDAARAVWINGRGTRLSPHAICGLVGEYGVRAGLEMSVSPHTLRHSCAAHLLQNGAEVELVREMMGHRTLGAMQEYLSAARATGGNQKASK